MGARSAGAKICATVPHPRLLLWILRLEKKQSRRRSRSHSTRHTWTPRRSQTVHDMRFERGSQEGQAHESSGADRT